MSKQVGEIPAFEQKCLSAAKSFCTSWAKDVRCYYDGSPYSKRDFVITAHHTWGSAYCDWSYKKNELKEALRQVGATNIIGRIEWNFIDIAFDISAKALKEFRKEMGA